jgi:nitrogen fixation-related uncharacterized protein
MHPAQQTPQYWLAPGPDLPPRTWQQRSRTPIIIVSAIVGVVLAVIALGAVAWGVQGRDFTAEGEVVLTDDQYTVTSADGCSGTGDFEDLKAGTRVRVLDEELTILEEGELGAPQLLNNKCRFEFAIDGVPEGRDRYVVEIGTSVRHEASKGVLERGITFEF